MRSQFLSVKPLIDMLPLSSNPTGACPVTPQSV